jgi:hypothetical protein
MSAPTLPAEWSGLVDDAAIFPPGDSPLPDAVEAYVARREEWYAGLVGGFVVTDTRIPEIGQPLPLAVVVTGGAGAIEGALRLAEKGGHDVTGIEIALRDLDDLAGTVRRVTAAVDAARGEGTLDDEVPVYVELPHVGSSASWLAAADEVAAAELRLKFRTGGLEAEAHPAAHALAGWIDAALDRETPFKCTAGLHHAVRNTSPEGFEQHGFLNVLVATARAFDGASADDVVATLEDRDGPALAAAEWRAGRRWFTSFGSCSISYPLADLRELGLVEAS